MNIFIRKISLVLVFGLFVGLSFVSCLSTSVVKSADGKEITEASLSNVRKLGTYTVDQKYGESHMKRTVILYEGDLYFMDTRYFDAKESSFGGKEVGKVTHLSSGVMQLDGNMVESRLAQTSYFKKEGNTLITYGKNGKPHNIDRTPLVKVD